jgi:hypothetical protein
VGRGRRYAVVAITTSSRRAKFLMARPRISSLLQSE